MPQDEHRMTRIEADMANVERDISLNVGRLATVEADIANFAKNAVDTKRYLEQLFEVTNKINTSIALIAKNQEGVDEYKKECAAERRSLDKRVTETEGFQRRLIKLSGTVSGIVAIVITSAVEWLRK